MKSNRPLYYGILFLIFGFGIFLRVYVPDLSRQLAVGDETAWSNSGKILLKYGTLTRDVEGVVYRGEQPPRADMLPPPGYSLYLAGIYKIFGDSNRNVFISQIVLSVITLWLIYQLMCVLNIHPIARLIALLCASAYPGFYYNLDRVLAEQVFMTVFLLFVYFFVKGAQRDRAAYIGWSAFFLAAATYVKPQALPFAILVLFVLTVYKTEGRRLFSRPVLSFCLVFAISLAPWWIRNWLAFGKANILAESGAGPMLWGAVPYFNDMAATAGRSLSEVFKTNIAADPSVFFKWRVFGFLQYMWGDLWDEHLVHPGRYIQPLIFLQMLVVVPTLIALPLLIWKKRADWLVVACIPLAFTLMHMLYHGLPRYVQGSVPFVFICLGMLITVAINRANEDKREFAIGAAASAPNKLQRIADLSMRSVYMLVAVVFSAALFYAVYVFRTSISEEVSAYRLGKYAATTIPAVERSAVVFSKAYLPADITIENSLPKKDSTSRFTNNWTDPSLIKVVIPAVSKDLLQTDEKVVSKVTLNIRGGRIYDYSTVYWASPEKPVMSEDAVYVFPIAPWQKTKTMYMDSDVTGLMIVPVVFRGGDFVVRSIDVTKYRIKRN
ncbi:hypothetical protein A9G00_21565 [Achromobacter xylosoxidans]|nr:hypothetical protein A7P23_20680 [Achromobacter xylosoxidans]ODA18312.1 hypothetical protein A9G00_21565 [Achromobacter xylosoxidans]